MSLRELQLAGDRRLVVVALALLLVPTLWYVRTDLSLYSTQSPELLARLVVRGLLIATCAGGIVLMGSLRSRDAYSRTAHVVAWGIVISLLALNALRPEGAGLPLRSPLFTIALLYAAIPNSFTRQVLPPLAFTAGLIVLRTTRLTAGVEADVAGDLVILLSINAVGVLMVRQRLALTNDLENAWAGEAKARSNAEKAREELFRLAFRDPITGTYSRRYFDEALEREILRARRRGHPLSVLLVDIDRFKQVNDTHGHKLGDRVLADTAHALGRTLRGDAVTARYGGDEFAILLPECSATEAAALAERLRATLAGPGAGGTKVPRVTISIGVAACEPAREARADRLMTRADAALYRAKEAGRDRVEIAPSEPRTERAREA